MGYDRVLTYHLILIISLSICDVLIILVQLKKKTNLIIIIIIIIIIY